MRCKLRLQVQSETFGNILPINYQYELSAAIYRVLSNANEAYSSWLHENGFALNGKKFKLFTFSWLLIPDYELQKEQKRMVIKSDHVFLYISFLPDKSTKTFIKGLFKNRILQVGDKESVVQFLVTDIDILPQADLAGVMTFETLSPVCVSINQENGKPMYLSPDAPEYAKCILNGLLARYEAFYGKTYDGEAYCNLEILGKPKSSLVKIKAGTPQQTFVRGYRFRFKLWLPYELMEIAYESGVGEKGSLGFGMVKIV